MSEICIRDAVTADFDAIVALNAAEEQQTSAMDHARLGVLAALASHFKVATVDGQVAAFLLAMRESAPYENENFGWFSSRFERFFYVDRIVVGAAFGGLAIGTRLYTGLFEAAREQGVATLSCEYNIEPPNPASARFHDKFGFRELGRQRVAGGTKLVSLQAAAVRDTEGASRHA